MEMACAIESGRRVSNGVIHHAPIFASSCVGRAGWGRQAMECREDSQGTALALLTNRATIKQKLHSTFS